MTAAGHTALQVIHNSQSGLPTDLTFVRAGRHRSGRLEEAASCNGARGSSSASSMPIAASPSELMRPDPPGATVFCSSAHSCDAARLSGRTFSNTTRECRRPDRSARLRVADLVQPCQIRAQRRNAEVHKRLSACRCAAQANARCARSRTQQMQRSRRCAPSRHAANALRTQLNSSRLSRPSGWPGSTLSPAGVSQTPSSPAVGRNPGSHMSGLAR